MQFSPNGTGGRWNLTYEAYTPREGSSYYGVGHKSWHVRTHRGFEGRIGQDPHRSGAQGRGQQLRRREGIYIFTHGRWAKVASDILPAYPHTVGSYGLDPDLYRVGLSLISDRTVLITIYHTKAGLIYQSTVDLDGDPLPALSFFDNAKIPSTPNDYGENGGWFVDDLSIRPSGVAYPVVTPIYEYVTSDEPLWLDVTDEQGRLWAGTISVTIGGASATYSSSTGHGWLRPSERRTGRSRRSTASTPPGSTSKVAWRSPPPSDIDGISIAKWWNGWSWATVFGLDDCAGLEHRPGLLLLVRPPIHCLPT